MILPLLIIQHTSSKNKNALIKLYYFTPKNVDFNMTLLSNRAPVQISPVISPKNIFYGPYVINFFLKSRIQ